MIKKIWHYQKMIYCTNTNSYYGVKLAIWVFIIAGMFIDISGVVVFLLLPSLWLLNIKFSPSMNLQLTPASKRFMYLNYYINMIMTIIGLCIFSSLFTFCAWLFIACYTVSQHGLQELFKELHGLYISSQDMVKFVYLSCFLVASQGILGTFLIFIKDKKKTYICLLSLVSVLSITQYHAFMNHVIPHLVILTVIISTICICTTFYLKAPRKKLNSK